MLAALVFCSALAAAAVDAQILSQYKTTISKGLTSDDGKLDTKVEFYIPHRQCSGRVVKDKYCGGRTPLAMEATVLDYEPYPVVDIDMFNYVNVVRAGGCAGLARVTLRLLCPGQTGQPQSDQGCSGPGCSDDRQACSGPECSELRQGCSGAGCLFAQPCYGPGCSQSLEGCTGPGCSRSLQGCTGPGCSRSLQGCTGPGCSRTLQGCTGPGCSRSHQGCTGPACSRSLQGCTGPDCRQAREVDSAYSPALEWGQDETIELK